MFIVAAPVYITVFLLGLLAIGFLVVNALSIVLALFGIVVPAFGFLGYLSSGFLLVYIRGYFNSEQSLSKSIQKYIDKLSKE